MKNYLRLARTLSRKRAAKSEEEKEGETRGCCTTYEEFYVWGLSNAREEAATPCDISCGNRFSAAPLDYSGASFSTSERVRRFLRFSRGRSRRERWSHNPMSTDVCGNKAMTFTSITVCGKRVFRRLEMLPEKYRFHSRMHRHSSFRTPKLISRMSVNAS